MLEELDVGVAGSRLGVVGAELIAEFPSVFVRYVADADPLLRASEWERADFDTWQFDCAIDTLARDAFTLTIADDGARPSFPLEVLTRCQRHVGRRNRHSQGSLFSRVLREHRALHDLDKPLVRADYNHALDAWQWALRLDADAPVSVQIAALFHDIERLQSEPDARVEHLAPDYQQFKDAHASAGAAMTDAMLAKAGASAALRADVAQLVRSHEREPGLLGDADALSFFSLNSSGYTDYFGPEQTRKKVAYTWNRMSDRARARLAAIRLRPDVRSQLNEVQ